MKLARLRALVGLGGLGGVLSWILLQTVLSLQAIFSRWPQLDAFIYEGMVVGCGFGLIIYSKEALFYPHWQAWMQRAGVGALIGLGSGFLACSTAQTLLALSWPVPLPVVRCLAWTLLGFWIGAFNSFEWPLSLRLITQTLFGALGGVLGGCLLELALISEVPYLGDGLGLVLFGTVLMGALVTRETWRARSYVHVLAGENAGERYWLETPRLSVGYRAHNGLILRGYTEVCGQHAFFVRVGDQHHIINAQTGGQVLVNYRVVENQALKHGDILKMGSAILQYVEVK